MATVTIVSPTYNHASFIDSCIRSVLAQTVEDWEMIIVDDGSDDGTPERAEAFGDERIAVVRREHEGVGGLGRAYALALERSKGSFVAVLECDDTWPRSKLENQLRLFRDPSVVLSYGSAGLMDESDCIYARYRHALRGRKGNNDPVGSILPALVDVNFIVAVTVMLRRSALEQIGGFFQPEGVPYVDHPTWLRMATVGTFARSSALLGNWRRYGRQVTTRTWFQSLPDRSTYLQMIANEARDVVSTDVFRALVGSGQRDPVRQREEAAIADGRMALLGAEWRRAAGIFRQLVRTGEARTRVVASLGLLCAGAKTDMEWLISAAGRHSLPSRRHLASHCASGASGRVNGRVSL